MNAHQRRQERKRTQAVAEVARLRAALQDAKQQVRALVRDCAGLRGQRDRLAAQVVTERQRADAAEAREHDVLVQLELVFAAHRERGDLVDRLDAELREARRQLEGIEEVEKLRRRLRRKQETIEDQRKVISDLKRRLVEERR